MWTPIKCSAKNFLSLEAFEYNFKKGCTIVRAENRDDEGQQSNGGGKSSFIDVFAVGLIGQSLSDKSLKECVAWDAQEPFFIVILELEHPELGELYIERKVYNNTRPSELIILLNGDVPKGVPTKGSAIDILPGNKYLLDLIGISKDDLLSYYLISGAYYTPYMKAPAKQKTEVINRFSKADKIDKAIEIATLAAEKQVETYQMHHDKLENIKASLTTLEDDLFGHSITQTGELEIKLKKLEPVVETFDVLLTEMQEIKNEKVKEVAIDIDKTYSNKDEVLRGVELESHELVNLKGVDFGQIELDVKKVEKEGFESKSTAQEITEYINKANSTLAGKVECPSCHHEFNTANPKEDLKIVAALKAESEELLLLVKEEIAVSDNKISKLAQERDSLSLAYEKMAEDISKRKSETSLKFDNQLSELSKKVSKIESEHDQESLASRKEQAELIIKIKELTSQIETAKQSNEIMQRHYDRREKLQKELVECEKSVKAWDKDNRYELWKGYFTDFKFYLANKPIEALTQAINFFLTKKHSDLTIKIEGFVKLKNGEIRQKLNPIIYRNGDNPQGYGNFSGGERARLDISTDLAFQEMINTASPTGGLDFYQNDELLNAFDSLGVKNAANAFNQLGKPILLVTHSGSDLHYENIITIIKENGKSRIT